MPHFGHFQNSVAEPDGPGNGGLAGSFVSVVFFIVIGFRAVPDLIRSAAL
jgi:hypothetical protein